MNVYIPYTRLPSAYQEVEYIESSGTQIINTGYNITSNMRIVIDFYTPSGTHNNPILGTTYGSWSWTAPMVMNTNDGKLYIATGSGGPYFDGYTTNTKHSLDYNSSSAILDGSTMSISATFNTSYTLTLFYGNSFYGSARIYACQVYTGDTLARNFIPCYRKSDNVIGMYDLVNDQFYTNSGTGTFSKGNDVTMSVLKNIYIGEYGWKPGSNTVLYIPMKTDLLDHGPNNISVTNNNSVSIVNGTGYFGGASRKLTFTNTSNMSGAWTISTWFKTSSTENQWFFSQGTASTNHDLHCGYSGSSRGLMIGFFSNDMDSGSTSGTDGNWHLATFTYNGGGSSIIYLDGAVLKSGTLTGLNTGNNNGMIGDYNTSPGFTFNGYMSEYIIENKARTAQEISDYYNLTKSNYGL